jgi:hypothetical protein
MFEWIISKNQLIDLIKKMSLPLGKNKYVFETVAPLFTPNDFMAPDCDLEWIAKTENVDVWVRYNGLNTTGLIEPIRIPFNVYELVTALKHFKNERLLIAFDIENRDMIITEHKASNKNDATISFASLKDVHGMQETLDIKHDNSKLHAVCLADIFHGWIDKNKKYRKSSDENYPEIYRIIFDGENQKLGTKIGDEKDRTKVHYKENCIVNKTKGLFSVDGNGEVCCSKGFETVMSKLKGEIKVSVIEDGSLLVETGDVVKAYYLIAPSRVMP